MKKKLLDVEVDGVFGRALIDTGTHVPVMNSDLRFGQRMVLTPATAFICVADGGMPGVGGVWTARITIGDRQTIVLLTVLEH